MWRCPRCGARNDRAVAHCGQCGMPNPFEDGGSTKTIDVPEVRTEPPRRRGTSLSWVVVAVLVLALVAVLLIAVVALAS